MQIWIRNDWEAGGIDEEKLRRRAARALSVLECEGAELSVWLCRDAEIQDLHGRYLGDPTPTNVMSFAQREGEFGDRNPDLLGDVVISVETAARDAAEAGTPLEDEVTFLLLHGILHLLGYDHEGDEAHRAAEMEAREEEVYRLVLDEA